MLATQLLFIFGAAAAALPLNLPTLIPQIMDQCALFVPENYVWQWKSVRLTHSVARRKGILLVYVFIVQIFLGYCVKLSETPLNSIRSQTGQIRKWKRRQVAKFERVRLNSRLAFAH